MHSCFLCIIVFLFSSKRLKDISLFKRRLLATFLKFLKKFSFHLFIVFARSVALFCICLAPAWKFTKLLCISGFSCLIYIKTPQETWLLGGPYWKEGYVNNGCCLSILSHFHTNDNFEKWYVPLKSILFLVCVLLLKVVDLPQVSA